MSRGFMRGVVWSQFVFSCSFFQVHFLKKFCRFLLKFGCQKIIIFLNFMISSKTSRWLFFSNKFCGLVFFSQIFVRFLFFNMISSIVDANVMPIQSAAKPIQSAANPVQSAAKCPHKSDLCYFVLENGMKILLTSLERTLFKTRYSNDVNYFSAILSVNVGIFFRNPFSAVYFYTSVQGEEVDANIHKIFPSHCFLFLFFCTNHLIFIWCETEKMHFHHKFLLLSIVHFLIAFIFFIVVRWTASVCKYLLF